MAAAEVAPGPAPEPPAGPCLLESRRPRRRLTAGPEPRGRVGREPGPRAGAQLSHMPEAIMVHAEFENFNDNDDDWLSDLDLSDAELGDEPPGGPQEEAQPAAPPR